MQNIFKNFSKSKIFFFLDKYVFGPWPSPKDLSLSKKFFLQLLSLYLRLFVFWFFVHFIGQILGLGWGFHLTVVGLLIFVYIAQMKNSPKEVKTNYQELENMVFFLITTVPCYYLYSLASKCADKLIFFITGLFS